MEQWLWAERKTPNRRKLSDSNRDVPSCVVTYLYPAKSTAGIVPCCCGFGRLHFSRWDGPPEKKSHLRSCSDRRVRVTSGFARDRPHGKRGQIFDGRGLMAGSLNYYHLSPPDLDGCRGTGGGRAGGDLGEGRVAGLHRGGSRDPAVRIKPPMSEPNRSSVQPIQSSAVHPRWR